MSKCDVVILIELLCILNNKKESKIKFNKRHTRKYWIKLKGKLDLFKVWKKSFFLVGKKLEKLQKMLENYRLKGFIIEVNYANDNKLHQWSWQN